MCAGKRQVWFLYRNGAIGWDEMELVSGFALGIGGLESRSKRNGIRLEIAKWRKGATLVVGTRG
jgi:hypothetical protein